MNLNDFDPMEEITQVMIDNYDEEELERQLLEEIEELAFQRLSEDDDDSFGPGGGSCCCGLDFPYCRDEAVERNVTRFMDGKSPDFVGY